VSAAEFLSDAYEFTDHETGYSTRISEVWTDHSMSDGQYIDVEGEILDDAGFPIGSFERRISAQGYVHHSHMGMSSENDQARGIGWKFYRESEEAYERIGIEKVTLSANSEVGGYAWARMGYDFRNEAEANWIRSDVAKAYANLPSNAYLIADIQPEAFASMTAFELAAVTGPNGERVGKETMLGSNWMAVKYLNIDDYGYRVGRDYYKYRSTNRSIPDYIAEKGGDGSGHWGHRGRPGQVGGSVAGAVGLSVSRKTAKARRLKKLVAKSGYKSPKKTITDIYDDEYFEGKTGGWDPDQTQMACDNILSTATDGMEDSTADFVSSTYDFQDPESGLHSKVISITDGEDMLGIGFINVSGRIYNEEGNYVGSFSRRIGDNGVVRHLGFSIDEKYQNRGFGRKFYQHQEETYKIANINKITLKANSDVGGYAWARLGYDFAEDYDAASARMSIAFEIVNSYGDTTEEAFKAARSSLFLMPAYELAAVTGNRGYRAGREGMLGSGWDAYKVLSDDDPGYLAGLLYYAMKDKQ
jgi:GNAT superfamily N-acetyltransferase